MLNKKIRNSSQITDPRSICFWMQDFILDLIYICDWWSATETCELLWKYYKTSTLLRPLSVSQSPLPSEMKGFRFHTHALGCSGSPAPPRPVSGSVSCEKTPELHSGPSSLQKCGALCPQPFSLFSPFSINTSTSSAWADAQSAKSRTSKRQRPRPTWSPESALFWF